MGYFSKIIAEVNSQNKSTIQQVKDGFVEQGETLLIFEGNKKQNIKSPMKGYFMPQVQNGKTVNNGDQVQLGKILRAPKYLNFWYSFIDLEKVIKENK